MTELEKQVVVFQTGKMFEFDMVIERFREEQIPFFTRQTTSSGLRFGMSTIWPAGPGAYWQVLVPEGAAGFAREVLSEMPIELKTESTDS